MRGERSVGFVAAFALATLLSRPIAIAQPEKPGDGAAQVAEEEYAKGLKLLQAGKKEEALAALESSIKALPSPNTELVRGHALRSLGRRVEAMNAYERVVRDAGELVRKGDERFEAALADAGTWIAVLRTSLAELTIEIRTGGRDVSVSIDDREVDVVREPSGTAARVHLFREPGHASVVVRAKPGKIEKSDLDLSAGSIRTLSVDVGPPTVVVARSHVPPAPAFVSWGVGVVGFGVLAVAGGLAASAMSDLDACRPHCTEDSVDDTRAKATAANVGLGIGIAGVLVGGAIWLGVEVRTQKSATPVKVAAAWAGTGGDVRIAW